MLSTALFNLFLEKIMQETHDHQTSITTGRKPMCNLRFADDIDLMDGSNGELQDLANRLVDKVTTYYGMGVSTEKSEIMTNISPNISMNGQKLEKVTSFKCLGETLFQDGT